MFIPIHQRLPMDCLIVALQAKSRLVGVVPVVAVLRFDYRTKEEAKEEAKGHAICVFRDEGGLTWSYEADGARVLNGLKRWAPNDLAKAWARANLLKLTINHAEFVSEPSKPRKKKKRK